MKELPLPQFVFCYDSPYRQVPSNEILLYEYYIDNTMDPTHLLIYADIEQVEASTENSANEGRHHTTRTAYTFYNGRCLVVTFNTKVPRECTVVTHRLGRKNHRLGHHFS